MKFFRIKNWEKFQHYKNRNPPWIKLYNSMLEDYEFMNLAETERCHLIMLWLLASRMGTDREHELPWDEKWLKGKIGANTKIQLSYLLEGGWIEITRDASKVLAPCKQNGVSERETERERETEVLPSVILAEPFLSEPAPPTLTGMSLVLNNGKEWPITQDYLEQKIADYPGLDVQQEFRAMRSWCQDNPTKRKTAKGIKAFCTNWLNTAQNRRGGRNNKLTSTKHRVLDQNRQALEQALEQENTHEAIPESTDNCSGSLQ